MTVEIDIGKVRNKPPYKVELASGKRGLLDPKKGIKTYLEN